MAEKKSPPKAGFGGRVMVMLLALALVVFGIYPNRREIKQSVAGLREFVDKHLPYDGSTRTPQSKSAEARGKPSDDPLSFSLWGSDPESPAKTETKDDTKEKAATPAVDPHMQSREQLDKLSTKDRKQLSDLVNSF